MSLDRKYIEKVLPSLHNVEIRGQGYYFSCPFCSIYQDKEYKRNTKCSAFLPHPKYRHIYNFTCRRRHSSQCNSSRNMKNFLIQYNEHLSERYQSEKNDFPDLTYDKPQFDSLKKKKVT